MAERELKWQENGREVSRPWITESDVALPKKVLLADDSLKAVEFYQQASEGAAYIYKGDFQNAKQLLQAVQRRIDKTAEKKKARSEAVAPIGEMVDQFHRHRQAQAHKARLLSRILICIEADLSINLRRAPDVREAITAAIAPEPGEFVVSLRDLLGFIGAHEWRKKGVHIPALDNVIHPYYGIFSPVRGEYLDLIAEAQIINAKTAFDIGTGTGVIAAILAKRGIEKIIATDLDTRAIACAKENIERLGFARQIEIVKTDLFPEGVADLIVCNPPWVPARATSRVERAVYDEDSHMLKAFLKGVGAHLSAHGETWLIMSNLAEHLGLRSPSDLPTWISESGLEVIASLETRPKHSKVTDTDDMLHQARAKEITSLWRLRRKK